VLIEHVLFSVLVNVAGLLAALTLLRSAAPRLVAVVCLASMLAVVVPWHAMGQVVAALGPGELRSAIPPGLGPSTVAARSASEAPAPLILLAAWLAPAALWLCYTFGRAGRLRRRWYAQSSPAESLAAHVHPRLVGTLQKARLRRLPGSYLAATTGLLRPEIWIGDRIDRPDLVSVAVNHELSHVAAGDHYFVHLLSLVERLLWWNPFVWALGRVARRHLEYACDQRCKGWLGERAYRLGLAEIVLHQNRVDHVPILALGTSSGVIHRMERLSRTHSTRLRHVFAGVGIAVALGSGSVTLASASADQAGSLLACNEHLPQGVHYRLEINYDPDTRGGDPHGELSVSLRDELRPEDPEAVPDGSAEYIQCLFSVLGIPSEEAPPAAKIEAPQSSPRPVLAGG